MSPEAWFTAAGVVVSIVALLVATRAHGKATRVQRQNEALERQSDAAVLEHLARRLRRALERLPAKREQPSAATLMRAGVLWTREDLREAERLAARLGPWAAGPLVRVVQDLEWAAFRVGEVRDATGVGFNFATFPWDQWETGWENSVHQLKFLERLAKQRGEPTGRNSEGCAVTC